MSFTDKKREEIKKYLLRKIAVDDKDAIGKTMDNFGISVTSAKRYLNEAIDNGVIDIAKTVACGYRLREEKFCRTVNIADNQVSEDRIFDAYIAPRLSMCNGAAMKIWQYACAEILNNAIEHSRGSNLCIEVNVNALYTQVVISDDGVGTFRTLLEYMSANGWDNPREEDALVELYKGKITSNPSCHSGEGIFFSSKTLDEFALWSDKQMYKSGNGMPDKVIQTHLLSYASRIQKIGTLVWMKLENQTERSITEVFNMYTDMEQGFIKTSIPIKAACINGEPVARSQARRICDRLETFKEVILDFEGVEFMGQGFADELFRVYASAHPQVILCPVNAMPDVERMIRHVGRGHLPENIKWPC